MVASGTILDEIWAWNALRIRKPKKNLLSPLHWPLHKLFGKKGIEEFFRAFVSFLLALENHWFQTLSNLFKGHPLFDEDGLRKINYFVCQCYVVCLLYIMAPTWSPVSNTSFLSKKEQRIVTLKYAYKNILIQKGKEKSQPVPHII